MHQNSLYKNRFYNEFYARINRKVVLVYVAHNKKQYRILLHTFYKIVDSTSLLDNAANYLVGWIIQKRLLKHSSLAHIKYREMYPLVTAYAVATFLIFAPKNISKFWIITFHYITL